MRVLFLDFDGVLSPLGWMKRRARRGERVVRVLSGACVAQLERLVHESGAVCVVTSTWRLRVTLDGLRDQLRRHWFTGALVDVTPHLPGCTRGDEIAAWRAAHELVEAFAIVDDGPASDFGKLASHLVRVNGRLGLVASDVAACVRLMSWQVREGGQSSPDVRKVYACEAKSG